MRGMKIKKVLIILAISLIVACGLFYYFVKAEILPIRITAETATLSISAPSENYNVGDTFDADIMLDTGGVDVDGVDVYYLNYSPSLLEVQDADDGTPGVQIKKGDAFDIYVGNSVDTSAGKISIAGIVNPGGDPFNGVGKVATVTFKVLAKGKSSVNFDFTSGSTTDCNVAEHGTGNDILGDVVNGSFILGDISAVPLVSIKANGDSDSTTIDYGEGITVSWNATDANSCIASGDWTGEKPTSGSQSFNGLTSSKTYTLICTGDGGSAQGSVIVNVTPLDENGEEPSIIDKIVDAIKAAPTGAAVSVGLVILLIVLATASIIYLRKKPVSSNGSSQNDSGPKQP